MNLSNKPVWIILALPLLAFAAYSLGILGESDRQKFDRLTLGMSSAEVQDIVFPRESGKHPHLPRMTVGPNDKIHFNNAFVLTMHNGVLVDKEWTGPDGSKKPAPQSR